METRNTLIQGGIAPPARSELMYEYLWRDAAILLGSMYLMAPMAVRSGFRFAAHWRATRKVSARISATARRTILPTFQWPPHRREWRGISSFRRASETGL